MSRASVILVAVGFAIGRFFITPRLDLPTAEGSYEAFAHLFVGGCFGFSVGRRDWRPAIVAIALSLVELFAFIWEDLARRA